jgi:hypothetical protein
MPAATNRAVANLLIGAAGTTAVYVVVTTPSFRRLALRAARVWIGAVLPVFLLDQARAAWVHSGSPCPPTLCGAAMGRDSDPRLT